MELQTRQFGVLEVSEKDILRAPKGLLGFEGFERFVLIDQEESRPFCWLQSVDTPELAFVLVSPAVFFSDYRVSVNAKEVADIKVERPEDVAVYVVVTVPEEVNQMTANLQGPILINSKENLLKQLVLTDSAYSVQHSIVRQLERNRQVAPSQQPTPMEISPAK